MLRIHGIWYYFEYHILGILTQWNKIWNKSMYVFFFRIQILSCVFLRVMMHFLWWWNLLLSTNWAILHLHPTPKHLNLLSKAFFVVVVLCFLVKLRITHRSIETSIFWIWFNIFYSQFCDYFAILLSLMPDNFTRQGENAATQWVNLTIMLHYTQMAKCTWLTPDDRQVYSSRGSLVH